MGYLTAILFLIVFTASCGGGDSSGTPSGNPAGVPTTTQTSTSQPGSNATLTHSENLTGYISSGGSTFIGRSSSENLQMINQQTSIGQNIINGSTP